MRASFLSFIIIALMALPVAGCSQEKRAVLHTDTGDYIFQVEIADTDRLRSKGLMFRQELAADAGMLFDFQEERKVSFWMRNTFIPLDMIFVDTGGIVRRVHANAIPQDPTTIPSNVPVRFVLEIPGGRSVEIGLKEGDRLEHVLVEN